MSGRLLGPPRHNRLLRFIAVGAMSSGIDAGVFLLLTMLTVGPVLASALSFMSAFVVNFKGNQLLVFKAQSSTWQLVRYTVLVVVNLGLSAGLVWAGVALGLHPILAKAISMVMIAAFNFLVMRLWVFPPAREIHPRD